MRSRPAFAPSEVEAIKALLDGIPPEGDQNRPRALKRLRSHGLFASDFRALGLPLTTEAFAYLLANQFLRSPADPFLYELLSTAVRDCVERVRQHQTDEGRIPTYSYYPRKAELDNGFPDLSEGWSSKVPNYGDLFGLRPDKYGAIGTYASIAGFSALVEHAKEEPSLLRYVAFTPRLLNADFAKPLPESEAQDLDIGIGMLVTDLLDRFMHINSANPEFHHARFLPLYLELETGMRGGRLPIELVVPIAITRFDSIGMVSLGNNVAVVEMSEPLQLARAPSRGAGGNNRLVVSAATHALVLGGWYLTDPNRWVFNWPEWEEWDTAAIDTFFSAVRIRTGVDTGYAQVLLRPVGWALNYRADLPPIMQGPAVRMYPDHFEKRYWTRTDIPVIGVHELADIGALYAQLVASDMSKGASIAIARLDSACLRRRHPDAILDACIGLEALLVGDSRTELTHKLATRAAALTRLNPAGFIHDAPQVFRAVKRIYNYRSQVVHGSISGGEQLEIEIPGAGSETAIDLAIRYLRAAIAALLSNREYEDPGAIDLELLLGSLANDSADSPCGSAG